MNPVNSLGQIYQATLEQRQRLYLVVTFLCHALVSIAPWLITGIAMHQRRSEHPTPISQRVLKD